MTIPPALLPTLQDILSSRQISSSALDYQIQLEQLYLDLDQQVTDAAIDTLSPEELDQLNQLYDANPAPEQVQQFFAKHVSNLDKITEETLSQFRQS